MIYETPFLVGFEIKFTKKFMLGINNLTITKKKSEV